MSAGGEVARSHKVRPYGNADYLRIGEEGGGKLSAANGLERRGALRSKRIHIAAMDHQRAATGSAEAGDHVNNAVTVNVSRDHGEGLRRAGSHTLRQRSWPYRFHRYCLIVTQPDFGPARGSLLPGKHTASGHDERQQN